MSGNAVVGRVGTNVEYAKDLELGFHGTKDGKKINMAARPFLRPGVKNNAREILRAICEG